MNLLYLLDANVLIDANRDYYPIERVPEFWDWLVEMGKSGFVKVPEEIYEEIVLPPPSRPDALVDWLLLNRDVMVLDEPVSERLVLHVVEQGYAPDLTDEEVEKIGRDPFLFAYTLANVSERRIVTNERSRPSQTRANRHIPDVGHDLGVWRCLNTFELIRELDFHTSWRARP